MTQSVVTVTDQTILIDDVLDVIHTAITQDTDGDWVREIRVYGTPAEGQTGQVQTLTLRLRSPTKENLNLTTAALEI